MTFDPTKPVRTRDGRAARIICTDRCDGLYPIVALVVGGEGRESIEVYTSDGRWDAPLKNEHPRDLFNIPEERSRWMNVYTDGTINWAYATREQANCNKDKGRKRVAILQVKIEGERVKDVIIHEM